MKTTDKKWNIRRLWILAMFFFVAFFSLSAQIPYAIWCSGNHTLYFTFTGKEYKSGGTFDGQYITNVWKGNAVVESGIQPQWNATVRALCSMWSLTPFSGRLCLKVRVSGSTDARS